MLRIDIYYVAGCPNRHTTMERVREVLKELNVVAEVREIRVDSALARLLLFRGSPTVTINGTDIEPSARTSTWTGVSWRTYREGERVEGAPSKELIRQAILDAGDSLTRTAKE